MRHSSRILRQDESQEESAAVDAVEPEALSLWEKELQQQFLAVAVGQTVTQLSIFKRGLQARIHHEGLATATARRRRRSSTRSTTVSDSRRNSHVIAKRRPSNTGNIRLASSKNDNNDNGDGDAEKKMPGAKVLNEIKLQRELEQLIRIYELAYEEIVLPTNDSGEKPPPPPPPPPPAVTGRKSYAKLYAAVAMQKENTSEAERVESELHDNQAELKALQRTLNAAKAEAVQRLAEKDERIATLRYNLGNVRRLNELEFSLVERWERNRCLQAQIICDNTERELQDHLDELRRRYDDELRIMFEVKKFSAKQFSELQEKTVQWRQRYAEKLAEMSAELKAREQDIADLQNKRERLEQTLAERTRTMQEYMDMKAEEERLLRLEMHRVECAVRIQAWWRGTMVRRGLGPYKKKSKKGKKGKKPK